MHIEEDDAAELKKWIVKKLENMYVDVQSGLQAYLRFTRCACVHMLTTTIEQLRCRQRCTKSQSLRARNYSSNTSQVLADYVLALIRAESPEPDLRVTAIESLEDFLKDST